MVSPVKEALEPYCVVVLVMVVVLVLLLSWHATILLFRRCFVADILHSDLKAGRDAAHHEADKQRVWPVDRRAQASVDELGACENALQQQKNIRVHAYAGTFGMLGGPVKVMSIAASITPATGSFIENLESHPVKIQGTLPAATGNRMRQKVGLPVFPLRPAKISSSAWCPASFGTK